MTVPRVSVPVVFDFLNIKADINRTTAVEDYISEYRKEISSELTESSRTTGINQTSFPSGLVDVRHLHLRDEEVNQFLVGHWDASSLLERSKPILPETQA
jgi:spermidine/putrescine-binding protein